MNSVVLNKQEEAALFWFASLPGGQSLGDTAAQLAEHLGCNVLTASAIIIRLESLGFIAPTDVKGSA